jgi:sigma-B regulation protein RsbQ
MNVLERNNVVSKGQGKQPMVFLHGFGCDQNMWRLITPEFEADYRIVLLDLIGAGKSDLAAYDPVKYSSLNGHIDDLLAVLRELDLHDVILVGHSVSAMIAVLAAIREPQRFARLVLVGPSPRYINEPGYVGGFERADIEELLEAMDNNYLGWSGAITPAIMGQQNGPELVQELNNSFCRTDPTIARHFASVTFLGDNRADLPYVTTQTLVVQCAHDVIAPVEVGRYVHEHLPNSQLVILDTSGHCPHLSAPHETSYAIKQFLQSQAAPTLA